IALWGVLLGVGLIFFIWSIRSAPFSDIQKVLSNLRAWQLLAIFLLNSGIILLFTLRWWLILRAQGHTLPYLDATRYRLAAFAISYFTPGQHFGGEPLQVLMVRRRHNVPGSTALAAVTLDKAIELFSNFSVLTIGLAAVAGWGATTLPIRNTLWISLALMLTPAFYLAAMVSGQRPIGFATKRLSGRIAGGLRRTEDEVGKLMKTQPGLLIQGLLISAIVWAFLFFEFWLVLFFLGLTVNVLQLIAIVTSGRLALLAPTPGALGALEASQVIAMQWLGFDPAYGLSLSLLIRARDIFFGVIGLLWAGLGKGQGQ
ncbi:MAG: lysylphosphatidylglycerol synthase transmembrane domain-containing protein, partial [Anaerolineales bacterium]